MKQLNCSEVPKNENWRKETQTSWAKFWVYIWGSSKTFRMFIIVFFSNFSYLCMIDLSQYKYHYLSTSLDSIIISNFINLTHSLDVKFFWHIWQTRNTWLAILTTFFEYFWHLAHDLLLKPTQSCRVNF